jgi:hypothetical protein
MRNSSTQIFYCSDTARAAGYSVPQSPRIFPQMETTYSNQGNFMV